MPILILPVHIESVRGLVLPLMRFQSGYKLYNVLLLVMVAVRQMSHKRVMKLIPSDYEHRMLMDNLVSSLVF